MAAVPAPGSPGRLTVEDAARELRCTVRTVWRDLAVLQEAHFPIYNEKAPDGRRGLWRVDEDFKRRLPLKLTLSELAALVMSRELVAPLGASVLGPSVASAFDHVAAVLPRDALALLARMRDVVGVRLVGAKLQAPATEHVPEIQRALVERRRLHLVYHAFARDEETRREVDPYHLTYYEGGLYLIAYCHLREAVRIFAVERIRGLRTLARRFEPPRDFDPREYLDKAWGILQGDLVKVRVLFAAPLARHLQEKLWHPSQKFRELPDGRVELSLRVADTLEVRRWILGFGTQAEVVEPESLRDALRQEAEGVARLLAPGRMPLATVARAKGRRAAGR
ncbi:MAG: WYL domain-containing transcriptional regulator [Candidatus Rokubacteria bacterium]|nr:WYL domain-containing transcriptional regulator [Candidatus Rokubacteria bacterium]